MTCDVKGSELTSDLIPETTLLRTVVRTMVYVRREHLGGPAATTHPTIVRTI